MNVVHVDQSNVDQLYAESSSAIKDFLYMLFEIAGDCRPVGDWDRAELGDVDPFEYLDIAYEYEYQLRSGSELSFLHRSAALNLICRLARIVDEDETSGSTWMEDFRSRNAQPDREGLVRNYHPELFLISEAFESGRVVAHPAIQSAFRAALYGSEDFYLALQSLVTDVVLRTFDTHFAGAESRRAATRRGQGAG